MENIEHTEKCLKILDINTSLKTLTTIIAVYEEVKKKGDELTVKEVIKVGLEANK